MNSIVDQLSVGFAAPLRGFRLIMKHRSVRRMAILPFLLSFLVFIVGLSIGAPFLIASVPVWSAGAVSVLGLTAVSFLGGLLYWVLLLLLWPTAIIALLYLLFVVSKILGAPLYALLAEQVLKAEGVLQDSPFRLMPWLATNARMIWVSVLKSVLFLGVGGVLFVLSFIPGVALLTGFGFLLIVTFDLTDYSFEAVQMSLNDRLRFFRQHFLAFSGFALTMGLVFLIPGLNFFLFPAAVAGGSDMVRRYTKQAR